MVPGGEGVSLLSFNTIDYSMSMTEVIDLVECTPIVDASFAGVPFFGSPPTVRPGRGASDRGSFLSPDCSGSAFCDGARRIGIEVRRGIERYAYPAEPRSASRALVGELYTLRERRPD